MDRRTKYTKQIIKDTFIELLNKKEINKITVSEICKIADINRATFYRYYLDIYDLLDKLEEEFILELKNAYKEFNYQNNQLYDYVIALLNSCLKNKSFVKVLFSTKNNVLFLNEVLEDAYERCKIRWEHDIPNLDSEKEEYTTVFLFNGTIGIVNYWIQNDFDKDVDEIANMVKELSYYGTYKFIYNKERAN